MSHAVSAILDSFRVLVQSLQAASRNSEQTVGLSGAQLFVLEQLAETKELTVNELAERTHTHQSTVSGVVSKLVDKNLVLRVRSETDARVQRVSITKAGTAILGNASETVQDRLLKSIKRLPVTEREQLSLLLQKVMDGAGLGKETPVLFLEESEKKDSAKQSKNIRAGIEAPR